MLNLVFFRVLRKLELNLSVDRERQNIVFSVCNSIIVHCLVVVFGARGGRSFLSTQSVVTGLW